MLRHSRSRFTFLKDRPSRRRRSATEVRGPAVVEALEQRLLLTADPNDQIRDAITLGSMSTTRTATGTIDRNGDVDMYRFTAFAGQVIQFDIDRTSGNLDTYLRLFNSGGAQLTSNDDAAGPGESQGLESYFEFRFGVSGTYYLGVSSFNNSSYNPVTGLGDRSTSNSGGFRLILTPMSAGPRDVNDQLSEAINLGSTSFTRAHNGVIDRNGDVDMYRFTVTAGHTLRFDIDRTSGNLDSYIRLFDSNGRMLAFSDDNAAPGESSGLDSFISHRFSSGGTFYLGVSSFNNTAYSARFGTGDRATSNSGGFRLTVSRAPSASPATPSSTPAAGDVAGLPAGAAAASAAAEAGGAAYLVYGAADDADPSDDVPAVLLTNPAAASLLGLAVAQVAESGALLGV